MSLRFVMENVSLLCTHSNGLLWTRANEAWGSLLTIGEPWRSQRALSGGLQPNLQDQGNFPIEMKSRCLSLSVPLSRCLAVSLSHRLCFCFYRSRPPLLRSNLALYPLGAGEEHEHHGKGSCPWARSHDEGAFLWEALPLGSCEHVDPVQELPTFSWKNANKSLR